MTDAFYLIPKFSDMISSYFQHVCMRDLSTAFVKIDINPNSIHNIANDDLIKII